MSENKVDTIFKEKLYDNTAVPPLDRWTNIQEALQSKKNRKFLSIYWAMAASLALIIGIGAGFYIGINHQKNISSSIASNSNTIKVSNNESNVNKDISELQTPIYQAKHVTANSNTTAKPVIQNNSANTIPQEKTSKDDMRFATHNTEINKGLSNNRQMTILVYQKSRGITYVANNVNQRLKINKANITQENGNITSTMLTKKQYFVGICGAPLYAYRNIGYNGTSVPTATFDASEKPIYSFSGGLSFGIIRNKWSFQTGVLYTQMGQQMPNVSISENYRNKMFADPETTASVSVTNNTYAATSNSMGNFETKETTNADVYANDKSSAALNLESQGTTVKYLIKYSYIEVPVLASYKLSTRWVDFRFSGGVSLNFIFGNKVTLIDGNAKENLGATSNTTPFNCAAILDWGVDIPMASNLHFIAGPRFRYFLNSANQSSSMKTYPYSFGLYATLQYHL